VLKNVHLAVRGPILGLFVFIAGYGVSLLRHLHSSALWILGVSIGCAAIFTVQELLLGRESLAYRCSLFGLSSAVGFLITHLHAIWWALGEWLVMALICRFFVYDPREKSQAPAKIPLP
jgi:hypothetical protein